MKQEPDVSLPSEDSFLQASEGLTATTLTSVSWSALGRISQQILTIIITIVLSRLLLPEAFGLIAMLMVFIGFANVFADSGLGSAIIQRKNISAQHISTAFTLNVAAGIILAAIFVAGSPFIAAFYGNPELKPLGRVLGLSFVTSSIGIVPTALLRRSLRFQLLAKLEIIASVIAGILAIAIALMGGGVWSLVVLTITQQTVRSGLALYFNEQKAGFGFQREEARQLIGFSAGLLGFNSINYWSRNADQLLIGRLIGASALGLYSRAYQLMMLPLTQINSILTNVMFPVLSTIQDQPKRISSAYSRALGIISLLSFPVTTGFFLIADPLIPLVYGEEWSGVVQVFRILCWVSLVQVLANPTGWIFTAMGKTRTMFYWSMVSTPVLILGIAAGALLGSIETVAWGYLIANVLLFYPLYSIIGRIVELKWSDLVRSVAPQLISALVMVAAVTGVDMALSTHRGEIWLMVAKIPIGILVYFAMIILVRADAYRDLYDLIGSRLGTYTNNRFWRLVAPR